MDGVSDGGMGGVGVAGEGFPFVVNNILCFSVNHSWSIGML